MLWRNRLLGLLFTYLIGFGRYQMYKLWRKRHTHEHDVEDAYSDGVNLRNIQSPNRAFL